jgi:UDP-N-acetylmuramate dehydrogenase
MDTKEIEKLIPEIKTRVSLREHTTFAIGGPAKYFIEVFDVKRLQEILDIVRQHQLRFFILAGGSNVLFVEDGFPGVVIKNSTGTIKRQGNNLTVDSGYNLHGVVRYACKEGLAGLEKLSWIPGSIGGAVYGNAGAYGAAIGEVVKSVEVYDLQSGASKEFSVSHCAFGYRTSIFKQKNFVILRVVLGLAPGDEDAINAECEKINTERKQKNPQLPSAGCFFENVPLADVKANPKIQKFLPGLKGDKLPAGLLIDKLGLKGKRIGGAVISEKHANFVVNDGEATADDVLKLADFVKTKVRNNFGIQLYYEVQIIG